MENFSKNKDCTKRCWIIAAVAGIVVALMLCFADWSFISSVFVGILIFIIGGYLLSRFLCKPQAQASVASSNAGASASAAAATTAAPVATAAPAAAPVADAKPAAKAATAKKPAAKKAPAKKAATTKAAGSAAGADAKTAGAEKAPAKKAAAKTTKTAAKTKASSIVRVVTNFSWIRMRLKGPAPGSLVSEITVRRRV